MAIIKKTKKYLPHHSWSFTITSNHPPDPEDYHLQHVPPKKNSLHPPKTNILYPKIPPPNGKKRYTSNPKLPLLGSFKKPKTFSPFRGFEPPTVFFQNRSLGKNPRRTKGSLEDFRVKFQSIASRLVAFKAVASGDRRGAQARWVCLFVVSFLWSQNEKKTRQRLFEVVGGFHSGSWRVNKYVCIFKYI